MKKLKAKQTVIKTATTITYIIDGRVYDLYSEFITEKMFSGKCYVVLCEDGEMHGLDSEYFEEV